MGHLNPGSNLKNKVQAAGIGDVIVAIDIEATKTQLEQELSSVHEEEDEGIEEEDGPVDPGPVDPSVTTGPPNQQITFMISRNVKVVRYCSAWL